MADLFDYLTWRGDLRCEQSPFNEVDGMILARSAYLPLEAVGVCDATESLTIGEVASRFSESSEAAAQLWLKDDLPLLAALAESARFSGMTVSGYVSETNEDTQIQFSAMTVQTDTGDRYVAFRGTDDTLIGWKENLNMSFVCPVPAQERAVEYLERTAAHTAGTLLVGGHSKGGNLAVYAAAFCCPAVQQRIAAVYNYDGPGFNEKAVATEEYRRVGALVHTFVPQSSVVGMLLGHEEKYTIVHSTKQGGILQHDVGTWEIRRDAFRHLQTVTNSSRFVDYTLRDWVAGMTYEQREKLVDTLFAVMTETNAHTLPELTENWFSSTRVVLRSVRTLDEPTRKAVTQTLRLLMKSAQKGMALVMQKQ